MRNVPESHPLLQKPTTKLVAEPHTGKIMEVDQDSREIPKPDKLYTYPTAQQPVPQLIERILPDVQTFESGAVRGTDADHLRYDLISAIALRFMAIVYAEGNAKYNPADTSYNQGENWRKGIPTTDLLQHAINHLELYRTGDRSEHHLSHACWNLFTAMHQDAMEEAGQTLGRDVHESQVLTELVDVYGRKVVAQAKAERARREAARLGLD